MYNERGYIIAEDKYNEMKSSNDSTCLSLVRFHTNKNKGSMFMSASHFTTLLLDTFNYHSQNNNHLTESYSLNIDDAGFLAYVDVDYDITNANIKFATDLNTYLANEISAITATTSNSLPIHENINIMTFIPQELSENETGLIKGGIHIFVLFPYMLVGQERRQFNASLLTNITQSQNIIDLFNEYSDKLLEHGKPNQLTINSLIDPQPLERYSSQIMPFTKKYWRCWGVSQEPEPRNYQFINIVNTTNQPFSNYVVPCHSQDSFNELVLRNNNYNNNSIDFSNISFDDSNSNNNSNNSNNNSNINIQWNMSSTPLPFSNSPNSQEINIADLSIPKRRKLFMDKLRAKFETWSWAGNSISILLNQCCFMFDFCSSLAILEDSHPFLEMFKKGIWLGDSKSANVFIHHLMDMYYVIFYLNIGIPTNFDKYLPELILDTIECLYIRGMKTNRNDVLSQITNYVNFCVNQRISNELKVENVNQNVAIAAADNIIPNDFNNQLLLQQQQQQLSMTQQQQHQVNKFKHPNKYDTLKDQELWADATEYGNVSKRTRNKQAKAFYEDWGRVEGIIDNILNKFTAYVNDEIKDKMEKEIEPFTKTNYERNANKYSFPTLRGNPKDYEYYIEQLQNLTKGFLFVNLYQYGMKCYNKIVEDIINAYTHHYIYCVTNDDKRFNYVYNIQQTLTLESMPYNQWVLDRCNAISEWTTHLLNTIFEPISKRQVYNAEGGINYMLRMFSDEYELLEKVGMSKNIKAINALIQTTNRQTFKKEVETNLIRHYAEMKNETIMIYPASYQAEYFAVRNGIIHFVYDYEFNKWKVEFLTDNHDKIIPSYSMAKYTPDYDDRNEYYDEVMTVLKDIYPNDRERKFILDFFSSTICPLIQKDNFLFMFGTGSDGKSTINSLLRCILGGQKELACKEYGKQIKLKNPSGYFGSMDASTMTGKKQRGAADEGGTINLKDKTYAVMMEPSDSKIRSETIKAWTGFGPIQARGIYQASQEVIVNCLIVCETNNQPSFDIIDDAMKRRIKVYNHKAKFVSETNKPIYKFADPRTIHDMNPSMINKIKENVEYWEAFLQILLKHAIDLLDNDKMLLSKIDAPEDVKNFTEASFMKSSSLSGWLENNIIENRQEIKLPDGSIDLHMWGWISAYQLINKIRIANNSKECKLLDASAKNVKEMTDEIVKTLDAKYGGRMFRIKPELIRKNENEKISGTNINQEKVNSIINSMTGTSYEDTRNYINQYIYDAQSVRSMRESITTDSYLDILILGVSFADGNNGVLVSNEANNMGNNHQFENIANSINFNGFNFN